MWHSPLHHRVILSPFPIVGFGVIIVFDATWADVAYAASEQKLDVAHSSLCRENVPVLDQSCTFSLDPRMKICEQTQTQLPTWSWDSEMICQIRNVSNKYLLLIVMQDELLNIDY